MLLRSCAGWPNLSTWPFLGGHVLSEKKTKMRIFRAYSRFKIHVGQNLMALRACGKFLASKDCYLEVVLAHVTYKLCRLAKPVTMAFFGWAGFVRKEKNKDFQGLFKV